jgi:hypothetical protein
MIILRTTDLNRDNSAIQVGHSIPFGDIICLFYAKHEHGTGIAGVSQFLFLNLTSVLIRLYPCYIKDYLWFEEMNRKISGRKLPVS